ncbi:Mur ligase family protein [Curtobacterium poinsettiae]|uniref:Mur ligase family protein n=1 Tax=Curtobacterium poinsettiae TaxID=159612 RepID=UPI0021C9D3E2|nr:Mur ligase family protein [Curtobacterium flaccumfaciens]UXN17320.1 Mur ligase family protein [Curtobacterium flaccumfaciens pv. poinsettiae]
MRFFIPILIGRILRALARARGGGSAYPGFIVLKLVPDFLQHVTKQFPNGVVFVLGSNGKSTTTHMISDIVRAHGLRVFTNPSGANLPQGIASALLSEVSLTGRLKADIGILEVDEAFAVELAGILSPSTVTMLNVQVDQLYRFFETERVATMMLDTAALSTANVITNHDDQFLDGYSGTPGSASCGSVRATRSSPQRRTACRTLTRSTPVTVPSTPPTPRSWPTRATARRSASTAPRSRSVCPPAACTTRSTPPRPPRRRVRPSVRSSAPTP